MTISVFEFFKGDLPGTPKDMGPPKMASGTHTIPISLGILMGIVWEAYHKGVPLLGVPENPIEFCNPQKLAPPETAPPLRIIPSYVPWSNVAILGMVIQPLIGNPYNGYYKPLLLG